MKKFDMYTKIILTVIAINLTLLTITNLNIIPRVYAKESASMNYGIVPINEDGSIDVNVVAGVVDVNIAEVGGDHLSHGGPIDVNIAYVSHGSPIRITGSVDCD